VALGEIEAVAAVMAGVAGLTFGDADAAAASLARAERLAASGRFPFLAVQLRWLEVTRLVLAGYLAAEQAWHQASEFHARAGACTAEEAWFAALVGLRLEQGRAGELADEFAGGRS
jgi:hypothetical protein